MQDALARGLASSAEDFVSAALSNQRDALEHQAGVKDWLRNVVAPAHHAFMKDPSQGKTADETLAEVLGD